jgi:hypothetical protein
VPRRAGLLRRLNLPLVTPPRVLLAVLLRLLSNQQVMLLVAPLVRLLVPLRVVLLQLLSNRQVMLLVAPLVRLLALHQAVLLQLLSNQQVMLLVVPQVLRLAPLLARPLVLPLRTPPAVRSKASVCAQSKQTPTKRRPTGRRFLLRSVPPIEGSP